MNNSNKLGLTLIAVSLFAYTACGSDDNPAPSNPPIISTTGGAAGSGGSAGFGTAGSGTAGTPSSGGAGGVSSGGSAGSGMGGSLTLPIDRPACPDAADAVQPSSSPIAGKPCWNIAECNGQKSEQFANQCNGSECFPFDNTARIEGYTAGSPLPPL